MEAPLDDPVVLKLLFHELSFNVLYSLYPCDVDEAAALAAVHLHMARGASATKDDVAYVLL